MNSARCTGVGCGQLIGWIRTEAGKNMPVDLERKSVKVRIGSASLAGPRLVLVTEAGKVHSGQEAPDGVLISGYVPHWSTCPATTQFRSAVRRSEKVTV